MKATVWLVLFSVLSSSCTFFDQWKIQQDVDYIKRTIVDNYPYLQVHKRRDGFDWLKRVDQLRTAERVKFDGTNNVAYLSQFLVGLNGHVHILDRQSFSYYVAAYSEVARKFPQYAPWVNVLTKGEVLQTYNLSPNDTNRPLRPQIAMPVSGLFSYATEKDYIYLRIPTFDLAFANVEGSKIVDFLRKHSSLKKKIIIDIRGNGGGSDSFWIDYLARPLISTTQKLTSFILYRGGQESLAFLKAKNIVLLKSPETVPDLRSFEDVEQYRYYSVENSEISPSTDRIQHGRIIVLTDGSNFSSAETFAAFCKSTDFANTVGTSTGGDGIGFDPIVVELPYSHLVLVVPICAALTSDGVLDYEFGTQPKVELKRGIDSFMWVKEHISEF